MQEIIPRWEWRTFAQDVPPGVDAIRAAPQVRGGSSEETYILSRHANLNVKIRFGVLDIKQLLAVNEHGLEQWRPLLKESFPLSEAAVARVVESLGVKLAGGLRGGYDPARFLDEVVRPCHDLSVVHVRKERSCHLVGECRAEVCRLEADGVLLWTVAVEQEDPRAVILVVRTLGLDGLENINYVRALKRLRGWEG